MPTQIRLDQAVQQVLAAAHQRIADAAETLGIVESRVGVLGRNQLQAPGLAVTSPSGQATQHRALHESWEIPLEVWSVVQTEDTGGEVEAVLLALHGRSIVRGDRTLSLPFVEDVQSADYEALGAQSSGRRVLARARLTVRIAIVEPDQET